ncbi:hypothetical protein [Aliikangiella maris]|uniref:Uncharacterized protein n=2 Tax=Aliikangiella maris TaxID=3162458 RepID=A0ABV2BPC7_9GAMM
MIDGQYNVVFRGQTVKSLEIEQVKANLVKLFKSTPEAIERLFTGGEVVIRKDLDYAAAMKYQSALRNAGALALIKEVESSAEQPAKIKAAYAGKASFASPEDGATDSSNDTHVSHGINNEATHVTQSPSKAEDISRYSAPSSQMMPQQQTGANTDIPDSRGASSLNAENQAEEVAGDFSVAEVGAQILPPKVYEKREVDTSGLSLASVGERILPAKTPEKIAAPSIDHLSLVDQ